MAVALGEGKIGCERGVTAHPAHASRKGCGPSIHPYSGGIAGLDAAAQGLGDIDPGIGRIAHQQDRHHGSQRRALTHFEGQGVHSTRPGGQ